MGSMSSTGRLMGSIGLLRLDSLKDILDLYNIIVMCYDHR
jgi:hypothetical protein